MGSVIGVIGGSGFYTFFGADAHSVAVQTPYGDPSAPITVGRVAPRAELRHYPYGHFAIYADPQVKTDQVAFLKRVLA
jgi:purine nucleoside phosphorylase